MAVVSCDEIKEGRAGGLSFDGSRWWARAFRVVTDDDQDGPATVVQADGLPALGYFYATENEHDLTAVCQSLDPAQDDRDARLWTVTARYSTKVDGAFQAGGGSGTPGGGGAHPGDRPQNPLDRPIEWVASSLKVKKAVTSDKDNKDVKNSAGLFYNPAYERDVAFGRIVATKNYSSFPYREKLALLEKINSANWYGFEAKTVKIDDINAQSAFENGASFVRVTWTFLYNPDKWNPTRILDRGPYYLVVGKPTYEVDAAGNILPEVLLDGAGGKSVVPTYNLFRFHDEVDFSNLL